MEILGIETSCDETAIAVIKTGVLSTGQTNKEQGTRKIKVLSNIVSSQVKIHAKYGGVVPNLAAREHVKNIEHVFQLALKTAKIKNFGKEIDLIAVTRGPGLGPSLLVGLAFARTLAWKYDKPLIGVNHLEGHIYSNFLKKVGVNVKLEILNSKIFPVLNLIVSGGHTELVLMTDHGKYKVIGETLDDAAGEAFDKIARLLGLGYPGGPRVAAAAAQHAWTLADKEQTVTDSPKGSVSSQQQSVFQIKFPRPMINSKNFNFSYAGLKTAVLYKVRDLKNAGIKLTDEVINQICYEFQRAALDVLVVKTLKAAQEYKIKSLFLSGGVSANKELRKSLKDGAEKVKINYFQPELDYTGDNAAMIALAGHFTWLKNNTTLSKKDRTKKTDAFSWQSVKMDANLSF